MLHKIGTEQEVIAMKDKLPAQVYGRSADGDRYFGV